MGGSSSREKEEVGESDITKLNEKFTQVLRDIENKKNKM